MNRGQTIYTSNAEALGSSGNRWANNAGFGCSVQIRGTDQNGKNCKIPGDEMWQTYQDIRKIGAVGPSILGMNVWSASTITMAVITGTLVCSL